jgi:hypothetical protein
VSSFIRVLGSLIGGLLLVALIGGGIGVYYLFVYGPGLAETNQSDDQGGEFGKKTDNSGCLQATLSKITNRETVTEIISNNVFLSSCLKASRPAPGFCDGAPKRTDRARSMEWASRQCAAANRSGRACLAAMQIVQSYCESPNYRHEPGSPIPAGVDPPENDPDVDPAPPEDPEPSEVDPHEKAGDDPVDQDARDRDPRDADPRDRDPRKRDRDDDDPRDRTRDSRDRDQDRRRDDRDSGDRDRGYSESTDHKKRRRFPW